MDLSDDARERELLDWLAALAFKLNRSPSLNDVISNGVSQKEYREHFWNLQRFKEKAGLPPPHKQYERPNISDLDVQKQKVAKIRKQYTNAELTSYLINLSEKLGRRPKIKDLDAEYSIGYYLRNFGTWKKALCSAGLYDISLYMDAENMIERFVNACINQGEIITRAYASAIGINFYSKYHYIKARLAAKKAVLYKRIYTGDQLVFYLLLLGEILGSPPTIEDLKVYGKISVVPYVKYFGSLGLAKQAIGMKIPLDERSQKGIRSFFMGKIRAICKKTIRDTEGIQKIIGCTPEFFRNHIESLFIDHMSWDNWGRYGWHMDHIIPCSAFDLTKMENIEKCFHYTNMQPLWWDENITKGAKILDPIKANLIFNRNDEIKTDEYSRYYTVINNARRMAGAKPLIPIYTYTENQLLQNLKDLAAKLSRTPNKSDLKENGISHMIYYNRFGSFAKACELVGLIPNKRGAQKGNRGGRTIAWEIKNSALQL